MTSDLQPETGDRVKHHRYGVGQIRSTLVEAGIAHVHFDHDPKEDDTVIVALSLLAPIEEENTLREKLDSQSPARFNDGQNLVTVDTALRVFQEQFDSNRDPIRQIIVRTHHELSTASAVAEMRVLLFGGARVESQQEQAFEWAMQRPTGNACICLHPVGGHSSADSHACTRGDCECTAYSPRDASL